MVRFLYAATVAFCISVSGCQYDCDCSPPPTYEEAFNACMTCCEREPAGVKHQECMNRCRSWYTIAFPSVDELDGVQCDRLY